ncbi:putative signal peptide protein [Puccinia sorghi]|uniref:Putative signal peptide protein n=1 Tax=Puccinia sorghi TaxID=27349 RepID=A0A0L6UG45_9BASI|nr:putative signal peptide protein [Puccinia sorghi]
MWFFTSLAIPQAVKIANTCNCKVVFFAVSNHLSSNRFKLVCNTSGANGLASGSDHWKLGNSNHSKGQVPHKQK